jgi:hypothetical protein
VPICALMLSSVCLFAHHCLRPLIVSRFHQPLPVCGHHHLSFRFTADYMRPFLPVCITFTSRTTTFSHAPHVLVQRETILLPTCVYMHSQRLVFIFYGLYAPSTAYCSLYSAITWRTGTVYGTVTTPKNSIAGFL